MAGMDEMDAMDSEGEALPSMRKVNASFVSSSPLLPTRQALPTEPSSAF
jgi:hypothetical protein